MIRVNISSAYKAKIDAIYSVDFSYLKFFKPTIFRAQASAYNKIFITLQILERLLTWSVRGV
jgi:hypothetical protein